MVRYVTLHLFAAYVFFKYMTLTKNFLFEAMMNRSSPAQTGSPLPTTVGQTRTSKPYGKGVPRIANVNSPSVVGVVAISPMAKACDECEDLMTTCFVQTLDVCHGAGGGRASFAAMHDVVLTKLFSYGRHGRLKEIESLLESRECPGIDTQDKIGATLLHIACQNGRKKVVKLALRRGANINTANHQGNTPLHYCFAMGHEELGNYLIRKGANDAIANAEGATCYEGLSRYAIEQL